MCNQPTVSTQMSSKQATCIDCGKHLTSILCQKNLRRWRKHAGHMLEPLVRAVNVELAPSYLYRQMGLDIPSIMFGRRQLNSRSNTHTHNRGAHKSAVMDVWFCTSRPRPSRFPDANANSPRESPTIPDPHCTYRITLRPYRAIVRLRAPMLITMISLHRAQSISVNVAASPGNGGPAGVACVAHISSRDVLVSSG